MVAATELTTGPAPRMSADRIVLRIPSEARFRSVATLVLGGVGSRAELPYERADDLQLAILAALDASTGDETVVEVETGDGRLAVVIGPVRDGSSTDPALARVLSPLVDEIGAEHRDGAEWLRLVLGVPAPAS
jgi:hypothetical protein